MKEAVRPKLVEVKWRDATGKLGWVEMDEATGSELALCYSVGYLHEEREDAVVLLSDIAFDPEGEDEPQGNGRNVIPRGNIVWMKVRR